MFFFFFFLLKTFNFAENGRHLSNQKYKACVRQERGMCSIAYEPCDERSFRIGPKRSRQPSPYSNPVSPYSTFNNPYQYPPNPYSPNLYQSNPYYGGGPPLPGNAIIGPNGMLIPNPYAPNGIVPNRIVYDANGFPSVIDPNGMLIPINPNALQGKKILEKIHFR